MHRVLCPLSPACKRPVARFEGVRKGAVHLDFKGGQALDFSHLSGACPEPDSPGSNWKISLL